MPDTQVTAVGALPVILVTLNTKSLAGEAPPKSVPKIVTVSPTTYPVPAAVNVSG